MSLATSDAPVRAAIYCRISRDDAGDMLGVRRQEKDARALCAARGWTVAEAYIDDDVSAWSGRARPRYRAMLEAIRAGAVDAVVAYDLDRLHRLPRELESFFDVCDSAGMVRMATVAGDVDLASNDGRLVARIMGAVAKKSSDDTSRRLKRKNDERAEAGLHSHGARAFGYRSDGVTVDEREAELLREAAADILAGESLNGIARRWNALGVTTPQRHRPWSGTVVKAVLTNPRQAGMRVHRGVVVGPGKWPAILDRETHDRLVATLNNPARRRSMPPRRTEWTTLIRCHCGVALNRDSVRGVPTYRCHRRPGSTACGSASISAVPLEERLLEAVFIRFESPALGRAIDRRAKAIDAAEGSLSDTLHDIERRMAELAEMFAAGDIDRPEWMAARAGLEQRQRDAKASMASLVGATALEPFTGTENLLRDAWSDLSVDRRRAVLAAVIDRVTIKPATRRGPVFDVNRIDIEWRF